MIVNKVDKAEVVFWPIISQDSGMGPLQNLGTTASTIGELQVRDHSTSF